MTCSVYVYSESVTMAGRVVPGSAIEYASEEDQELGDNLASNGDFVGWEFSTWEGMRAFFSECLAATPANASSDYARRVARSVLDEIEGF